MAVKNYSMHDGARKSRRGSTLILLAVILVVSIVVLAFSIRQVYYANLKPASSSHTSQLVTIKSGMSVTEISQLLKEKKLIRASWAFQWYIRDGSLRDQLQAGTYSFRPNQSVQQIVDQLTGGKIATNLVTILPGKRLDQIRKSLIEDGFSEADVDSALDPAQYSDSPILAVRPDGASLEGLLYPDSFQRTSDTKPKDIIAQSLELMYDQLTSEVKKGFEAHGLTLYEGITLASIVTQEVSNSEDGPVVSQVFLKRIKENMPLGSDVTAFYASAVAGQKASLAIDSPYNTHLHIGLPPSPISNVDAGALQATANPSNTDWLYFVAGDDGKTYYAKTLEDHEKNVEKYCKKLCEGM